MRGAREAEGASSPKEFQEFSSPRIEGNSSRGLDHFVPRSFYFPLLLLLLLLLFFLRPRAPDTRGITARKLGHPGWKILEGEGGEIEPRVSNSNVIREQAVFFSLSVLSYSLANLLHR